MRRLGQHFLKNASAIKKIITALELAPEDAVVEIGPGRGALTVPLAKRCAELGCSLVAIEKDEALAEALRGSFMATGNKATIIADDILAVLKRGGEGFPRQPYKVVGNIPYYITGHLLRLLGELEKKPVLSVFTVQKEVALRMCAVTPHMNRLAASIQYWSSPEIIGFLKKEDFSPRPNVESAIVVMKSAPERTCDPASYYRAVKTLFAQPRKTILNNASAAFTLRGGRPAAAESLLSLGIIPEARPQDLSIEDIEKVAPLIA